MVELVVWLFYPTLGFQTLFSPSCDAADGTRGLVYAWQELSYSTSWKFQFLMIYCRQSFPPLSVLPLSLINTA